MKKYDEILSYNRLLCQKLPEEDSNAMFLQIDKDNSLLRRTLEQKVSEIGLCPIVNCVYHSNLSNIPKSKRNRTKTSKNVNSKTQKLADQNEFQLHAKRHTAKLNINIHSKNSEINQPVNLNNKFSNHSVDEAENSPTIVVHNPPPLIMLIRTDNFHEVLKKINAEWGQVESKLGGPYIKQYVKKHRKLTNYLKLADLEYFTMTPRSERPIKAVIRGIPPETPADYVKESLIEEYKFEIEKVAQLTQFKTKRPLPINQITLKNNEVNKSGMLIH
ncbi:hypothetical protein AVEN_9824-1 [Araneus ventricosus]|uniref:Pre-C2HC domain-containing protein n=1 Tax=Araneus ventricosus TaxID=182803 RepID=A0A4Y2ERH5_ARAVE|nr:hypothetical protein AVEN_9824-1 [Araneus ventricosus]